jgi:hypothetical protein
MSVPTIAQQRLYHQRISHSTFQTPVEVVQWLGAIQAQDYASAEWTIGVRLPNATPAHIEEAIAERAIVRTWLLRGTLHMVAAADLKWMRTLLAPALIARFAPHYRQLGIDDAFLSSCYAGISEVLEGGQQFTRKELVSTLEQRGINLEGERAGVMLNRAALDGLLCLGPAKGKQPSFVLLDEWIATEQKYGREEALSELALRYFTSHGPTTVADFAWWTGLTMPDAKVGFEAIKAQLIEEKVQDKSYWRSPTSAMVRTPTQQESAPSIYLLPGFDEFVLGYSDRSDFLEAQHRKAIWGVNAVFAYTMLLDGQIVGTWKRTFRKGGIEITLSPFAPLSPATLQAFTLAAQPYGEFYALPTTVVMP